MTTYVAGQELDVNPADVRVNADIGISAWDGTEWQLNAQLADGAAREIATVSPSMRNYIVAQKKIAAAQVAADPVLASLKTTWTEFETASQPIRERRAADRERETWEPTPTDVVLARHDRARVEIREAVTKHVDAKLQALATLEQSVRAELDDPPSWRPTAEDMAAVIDLRQSLQLLTTDYAVPILMRQLVLEPAMRGKGQGKVTALLPILRSMYETNAPTGFAPNGDPRPRGYHTPAVWDVITQAKAVQRDADYYAAHQKLQAIQLARYKLGVLATDYAHGMGTFGGTPTWFAELGVPAPKEPEQRGPYLGELA